MEFVAFYHVVQAEDLPAMREHVDPGNNSSAQYGRGLYTFRSHDDAIRWQEVRRTRIVTTPTVIVEFHLRVEDWQRLRSRVVPDRYNWRIPSSWLTRYDVLEGPWDAPTPDTEAMAGTWQVKFNPHLYALLAEALVHAEEEVEP